jgi:hypothetical protein
MMIEMVLATDMKQVSNIMPDEYDISITVKYHSSRQSAESFEEVYNRRQGKG